MNTLEHNFSAVTNYQTKKHFNPPFFIDNSIHWFEKEQNSPKFHVITQFRLFQELLEIHIYNFLLKAYSVSCTAKSLNNKFYEHL